MISHNDAQAKLIDEIFQIRELQENPPVLIDIGAASRLHPVWNSIAKHSTCIAFDADEREFSQIEQNNEGFKRLHLFRCIVKDDDGDSDFYLTKSPHCSSVLPPQHESLQDWAFSELFEVEKKVRLKSRSLKSVMDELNLNHVDWFKTDSQGIDLRLFQSLGERIISTILIADFEPGIIDAYRGEDKLFAVLAFMENHPFWVSDLEIKGTQRLGRDFIEQNTSRMHLLNLKISPGWGEISFINTFRSESLRNRRSILLGWIFSTLKGQHGFALEVLRFGKNEVDASLYERLKKHSEARLFSGKPVTILRRIKRRLIRLLAE